MFQTREQTQRYLRTIVSLLSCMSPVEQNSSLVYTPMASGSEHSLNYRPNNIYVSNYNSKYCTNSMIRRKNSFENITRY